MGYVAALFIGISLGLIGGGGSILTVPVLVYLFAVSPVLATSYSLFVVGTTSLVGAFSNWRRGMVRVKTALLFGISSISTVFLTRKFLLPVLPAQYGHVGRFVLSASVVTMLLFAILMIAAAVAMVSGKKEAPEAKENHGSSNKLLSLAVYGIGIGLATGLLGAGGGFLLIPTLVLLLKLPMKEAVGTSLFIIALNSLIGFVGDIGHFNIDWTLLLVVTAIAVAGIFAGGWLSKKINGEKLKKAFGWFVGCMGMYIIFKETIGQ
jgi:uncharacterized membrane protein YfcA